jgi:hypothetical protein
LDTTGVDIAWTLSAPGYLSRDLDVTLGPVPGFPDQFAPAVAGVAGIVRLHRQPIVLRGRVVQLVSGQLHPVPMPLVPAAITGVWWTFPPADVDPITVMQPANLVSLHPGLYADRAVGVGSLRRRSLAHVPGQDKTTTSPVVSGDSTARISNRIGVVAGTTILAFEPSRPDRVEYVVVTNFDGASTDDQPARVVLAHPLQLDHEEGTDVHVMTAGALSAPNLFDREGLRSDRVAFLAGMAGITDGIVEIDGGTPAVEYQTASLYSSVSDADGYYRLPPLSRVASVRLQTPALTLVTSPNYGRYENHVDLVHP